MNRNYLRTVASAAAIALACGALTAGNLTGDVSGGKGMAAVYVDAIAGKTFPAPAKHAVMDQKGLMFQPHVMIVQVGTTVDFLNSDKVQHNIFWPVINGNKKLGHNMGTWPTGQSRSFQFTTPGVAPLLCNVHPEMSGYLVIVPTPYSAMSDASGHYKIENLPPGQYTVSAWREGMKVQSKPVTVTSDATLDFALSK